MIITKTPLRVSLFGGGTDFPAYYEKHGGCFLSTAIDKFIYVIIKARFDSKVRVGYSVTEMVDNASEVKHDLIREALLLTGITNGVEISTMADIPSEGCGLGSSSAVTVGALHAMAADRGRNIGDDALAVAAVKIELDTLKSPIGIQDQIVTAFGGMRFFEIVRGADHLEVKNTLYSSSVINYLNARLMLFYTGITRKANGILAEQKRNMSQNEELLYDIKHIAYTAHDALKAGNYDEIGQLLHKSWKLKKQLSSTISNPEIDAMYKTARKAGALGGKISGAGGGGFMLLYCPIEKQDAVRAALGAYREMPFNIGQHGSRVIFNGG